MNVHITCLFLYKNKRLCYIVVVTIEYWQFWKLRQTSSLVSQQVRPWRAVILVIMHVEIFKTGIIAFIGDLKYWWKWSLNTINQTSITWESTQLMINFVPWQDQILFLVRQCKHNGVPGEKNRPVASHWQTLSHNVVSSTPRHEQGSNPSSCLT
jgi:hypothetical protein